MVTVESVDAAETRPVKVRVATLDGVRGLSAVGVLIYHVAFITGVSEWMGQSGSGIWGPITNGLSVCLGPLFVLSGMLLFRAFARSIITDAPKPAISSFLWRRALRILPAYFFLAVGDLLLINLREIHGPWYVLRPLLLFHFFWPGGVSMAGMEQTWTVPAEMTFYLCLPLVAWLAGKYARRVVDPARRARRMALPLAVFAFVGFGWTAVCYLPAMASSVFYLSFWPFGYFSLFAAGMALGTLSAYSEVAKRPPAIYRLIVRRPNLCWLAAGVIYLINLPELFGHPGMGNYGAFVQELLDLVFITVFAVLVVVPLTVPGMRSRLMQKVLANRPVRSLGRISYGIYLWHLLFIYVYLHNGSIFGHSPISLVTLRGDAEFWAMLGFVLGGSIVAATVSYLFIERPAHRLAERIR
jgi:peptidoglycan/LPS O-acetylase OafA/YrhL